MLIVADEQLAVGNHRSLASCLSIRRDQVAPAESLLLPDGLRIHQTYADKIRNRPGR